MAAKRKTAGVIGVLGGMGPMATVNFPICLQIIFHFIFKHKNF